MLRYPQWLPNKGNEKAKKNTRKKRTTHPGTGSHPLTTPDDDDDDGDLNCELRNGNCELRAGNYEWASLGWGRGSSSALAATIKISKIHHWKNGRKSRRNEAHTVRTTSVAMLLSVFASFFFVYFWQVRGVGWKG